MVPRISSLEILLLKATTHFHSYHSSEFLVTIVLGFQCDNSSSSPSQFRCLYAIVSVDSLDKFNQMVRGAPHG